jgi:hypothetical protein
VPHTYIITVIAPPFLALWALGVHRTSGAEFLEASSMVGSFFNPDYFIGYIFPVSQIFLTLQCALLQFSFLSSFTSCD